MSLIVIAAADATFEKRVRGLLPRPAGDVVKPWEGGLGEAAQVETLAGLSPAVVILGPELGTEAAFEVARRFDRLHPTVSVLVITEPGPDTWQRALAAGVRGVIAPNASDDELRGHLLRALEAASRRSAAAAPQAEPPRSRVITVVSPKGGSGKTIVSTNLAVGLASQAPGNVVLVDLDLQFGDIAYALALTPQHTMADAVSALEDLDAVTLKVFLTRHHSGLYALCAPTEPADGEIISAAAAAAVIALIASEFSYVVIDTAAGLGEHALAALERSTDVVLISDMDVPSVRNLRKALDAMDALGMTSPARHFVLNRSDSRVGLAKEDVAAAAGIAIDLEIPSSRHVPVSLNRGQPILMSFPRSAAARGLAELALRFAAVSKARERDRRGAP